MIIKGDIDEIRFRNEENGYTIAVVDFEGDPLVCVGTFPSISEGMQVELDGKIVVHPKFGRQFKADSVLIKEPETFDGVIRYLGSGQIPGVGPKTAAAIVYKFKDKTFDIIENAPRRLTEVKGISKSKADAIYSAYGEIKNMRDAVMFLQSKGVSSAMSIRIFKKHGKETIRRITKNPYSLIDDIDGIGFLTADKIAGELNIAKESEFRICAGIMYVLSHNSERAGNTFLPYEELSQQAATLLKVQSDLIDPCIETMQFDGRLKRVRIEDMDGYMLAATFKAEKTAAVKLVELKEQANQITIPCMDEIIKFEQAKGIVLHEMQKRAVECAVASGVSVITGGPGTGKTTIIECILSIFDTHNLTYKLVAPTGRAAKRMSESTGREASTIHRALMNDDSEIRPNSNVRSLSTCNVVIVDEVSMMDVFLCKSLLEKLKGGTRLIFVGDKDQLPSVGAGNVLKDIMQSGFIPTVNLTEVYRQSEQSLITLNAHAINNGRMPKLNSVDSDFFFVKVEEKDNAAEIIVDLASRRIPSFLKVEPSRVQVLSPMKNGTAGVYKLNELLQKRLNNTIGNGIESEEQRFKKGDRVMHIANNYQLEWRKDDGRYIESGTGVFNGDLGTITDIRQLSGEIDVLFEDGRQVVYTRDIHSQLNLAYAITVHKSQGCEFDGVIVPILNTNPMLMTRNLLYTAITRAKKIVVLVGTEYNIKRMVDNNFIQKRYSALSVFLTEAAQKYAIFQRNDL